MKTKHFALLGSVFAATLLSAANTDAASLNINPGEYPIGTVIGGIGKVYTLGDIKTMIDRGVGKYTYVDDSGKSNLASITSDMCKVYADSAVSDDWKTHSSPESAVSVSDSGSSNIKLPIGNYHMVIEKKVSDSTVLTQQYAFRSSVISSITWPEKLTNTSYMAGDKIDFSKDNITLTYENGTTSTTPISGLYTIAYEPGYKYSQNDTGYREASWEYACTLGDAIDTSKAGTFNVAAAFAGAVASFPTSSPLHSGNMTNKDLPYNSTFDAGSYYRYDNTSKAYVFQDPALPAPNTFVNFTMPQDGATEGIDYPVVTNGPMEYTIKVSDAKSTVPKIRYNSHIQDTGWQRYVSEGTLSGTTGKSKRLEALMIAIRNQDESMGSITYRAHVQYAGWMDWVSDGDIAGTTGKSRRMEAVEIKLTNNYAKYYDISYRVHCQSHGWMDWKKNGEPAGTTGQAKRMEAIEIKITKKS